VKRAFAYALGVALCAVPALAAAQMAGNPVSDALRATEARESHNLQAAIEAFPAAKFGYKPTAAQMTVGAIAAHLAEGNDYFCSLLSGETAPQRTKIEATTPKAELVARLRETFQFCDSALVKVTDATLADSVPSFGGRKATRAAMLLITVGDWADHYSQLANYLRLNGMLPPTAQPRRGGM
jgi:uncharacterized damage-inducible protein DinB